MTTGRRGPFIELLTILFVDSNGLIIAVSIREAPNDYERLTMWGLLTNLTKRPLNKVNVYCALKT